MKSSAAYCNARRPRGATFDEDDEPGNVIAPSLSEANSTTCHCHCPSSRCGAFVKDDGLLSSPLSSTAPTTACDLCERLRGKTILGGRYDSADAIWTGDNSHVADRPSRRKCDENDLLANDSETTVGKRDRTLRCDRTSLRESSARCASSVVRWLFAIRFHGDDSKSIEWRRLLWIVLLILAVSNLAAAHRSDTTINPSSRNGDINRVTMATGKGKKKANTKTNGKNNGKGTKSGNGGKSKGSKKSKRSGGKARFAMDIFNEEVMENAYYTCHNIMDVLKCRGFPWPDIQKKKGKRKK